MASGAFNNVQRILWSVCFLVLTTTTTTLLLQAQQVVAYNEAAARAGRPKLLSALLKNRFPRRLQQQQNNTTSTSSNTSNNTSSGTTFTTVWTEDGSNMTLSKDQCDAYCPCSASDTTDVSSSVSVSTEHRLKLRFLNFEPGGEWLEPIARAFEAHHNVEIELVYISISCHRPKKSSMKPRVDSIRLAFYCMMDSLHFHLSLLAGEASTGT
ncbi:expressed unknown protein [Seminavis robusta]|uniref:Uncharacterized protein n=1 Tax=Seminavis robusta TaxID=568900 RepID=A0A9N8EMA7_9STRA|nr:expressed unknown protein [Seminavis robusta]|eukprot:Sro1327_g263090.1 n/a (211) ;mRNA; f:18477-19109